MSITKLLDVESPEALKLWADKVYAALQDLLGAGATVATRVQRGVITITGAVDSATATVESVDIETAQLRILGQWNNQGTGTFDAYLELTNTTTITATRGNAASAITNISWELTSR